MCHWTWERTLTSFIFQNCILHFWAMKMLYTRLWKILFQIPNREKNLKKWLKYYCMHILWKTFHSHFEPLPSDFRENFSNSCWITHLIESRSLCKEKNASILDKTTIFPQTTPSTIYLTTEVFQTKCKYKVTSSVCLWNSQAVPWFHKQKLAKILNILTVVKYKSVEGSQIQIKRLSKAGIVQNSLIFPWFPWQNQNSLTISWLPWLLVTINSNNLWFKTSIMKQLLLHPINNKIIYKGRFVPGGSYLWTILFHITALHNPQDIVQIQWHWC